MATYSTYEQKGLKEDVSDIITNLDPTAVPFTSSIKEESISNILHSWQEDSLAAPALNAQPEGFTATAGTQTPTTMRSGVTQILGKTVSVAATAQAVTAYGRAKEMAYQLVKAGSEVKRDLEFSCVGNAQTQNLGTTNATGSGTARKFDSVQAQIDATAGTGMTFYQDNASNTVPGSPVMTALSEDVVLLADQALFAAGSEATILMVKPGDALKIAGFAYKQSGTGTPVVQRSRMLEADETTITNVVDFYRSPFGTKRVVLNRWMRTKDALLYDPKYWARLKLRGWTRETLAKTGDSTQIMLVGEFGLKHRNKKASALITDLV